MNHTSPILPRLAEGDKSAVGECIDAYGSLIWGMAKKYSDSLEAAEQLTEQIFLDIWRHAARYDARKFSEPTFIIILCRRRIGERDGRVNNRLLELALRI